MTKDIVGLYKEFLTDREFERLDLFELLQERYNIVSAIYPGSYVHVTPSFIYPITVYIDSDKNARRFFEHPNFMEFINSRKKYKHEAEIVFYPKDYQEQIEEEKGKYNLLISQYAGFVSMHCKEYLKVGGILLVNNSHGDASMASIDKDYEFVGVIQRRKGKHRLREKNLGDYFVPNKEIEITKEYLEKTQKGIGYKKTASSYLFRRMR